jgi:hypothetical protein
MLLAYARQKLDQQRQAEIARIPVEPAPDQLRVFDHVEIAAPPGPTGPAEPLWHDEFDGQAFDFLFDWATESPDTEWDVLEF